MTEQTIQTASIEPTDRQAGPAGTFEEWRGYCRSQWKYDLQRKRFAEGEAPLPEVLAEYVLDDKGRISKLPDSQAPYFAFSFQPTPTRSRTRHDRQRLALMSQLAADMREHGLACDLPVSPRILDMRPWQWEGFRVAVRYTHFMDLPHDAVLIPAREHDLIRYASQQGFVCSRAPSINTLVAAQAGSDKRLDMRMRDLAMLERYLGNDALRVYVCRSATGNLASTSVELLTAGGQSVGLFRTMASEYAGAGPDLLLRQFALSDLANAGATTYDWNDDLVPDVRASEVWGAKATPYYQIEEHGITRILRHALRTLRFRWLKP